MTYIALLRGINVGGKAALPMRDLVRIFKTAGATGVETYIQSGNVVFTHEDAEACVAQATKAVAERFGYPGRIVLRSAEEMRAAYEANPFAGAPAETLHVYFLADWPLAADGEALDPDRSPGDSFAVVGREVYLHLPGGMARTKLTNAYFDGKLRTVSTARNWRTVAKLVEISCD